MDWLTDVGLGLDYHVLRLDRTDEHWIVAGERLRDDTAASLVGMVAGVEQIGSSSVIGLLAKPIIDIAVGIAADQELPPVLERLEAAGWIYRGDAGANGGHVFVLEVRPWHRVAHIHVVAFDGEQWRKYLLFRDLLRRDPAARARYESVKHQVAAEVGDDRTTYTDRKSIIVGHLLDEATDASGVTKASRNARLSVRTQLLRSDRVSPFAVASSVERVADGRYRAFLDDSWNLRPLPQGGIVSAIALRAMSDALDAPGQTLRTMHTLFVGQVADGDLEIDVEILRRGRSMSHVRAHVRSPGTTNGHITTAVFGASREGFEFTELRPPEVPLPEHCPSFRDPPPPGVPTFAPNPFWATRVEGRAAMGVAPWEVVENRTAEQATWYRFDDTPWIDNGTRLDPFAVVLLADTMPGAIGQRVGSTGRPWFGPSVDLTVHMCADCHNPWVLGHNTARWAGDGYASVDMALWDHDTLVAYATQTSFFTFLPDS